MKNIRNLAVTGMYGLLVLILLLSLSGWAPKQAEALELKLAHCMSSVSVPHKLFEYYAAEIYKRSKGSVKITVYPSGVLTPPGQHYEAVKAGIVDIVHHSTPYTPEMFPVLEVMNLPVPAENVWVFDRAAADFASRFEVNKLKELADVHFLAFAAGCGPRYVITRGKPALRPEDLKGLKLRCVGPQQVQQVKAWGASPVSLPMGEVFEGLSKGVIDGGILPGEPLKGFKLADVTKYLTLPPSAFFGNGVLVMNLKTWNRLPKDIQELFTKVSEEFVEWDARVWWYTDLDGMKYFLSLPGRTVTKVPGKERAEWEKLATPVTEKYIADKSAMGFPAKEYGKYLEERSEYWNKKQLDEKTCMEWVEKEILKLK
jgi:TRAP-type C4-dicarboxylate transport system substrate-binding protein